MKIIADSNILFVEDAFGKFGELCLYKTKIDDKDILKDADVLLCRSTMKIDRGLLEGTGIKFVATATSGTEHFDTDYLKHRNIKYADAKGSNSNSVAEYVTAALLNLAVKNSFSLKGKSIGIVGYGCVGKIVEKKAQALGLSAFVNDPPLEDAGEAGNFYPIEKILSCDIITLHVPLTFQGEYRTKNLIGHEAFKRMSKQTIFINASRGPVVDEDALCEFLKLNSPKYAVIDVWNNEPGINTGLLDYIDIATPHIAGHSLDGKALGTAMIYDEFCRHFNLNDKWDYNKLLPEPEVKEIEMDEKKSFEEAMNEIVKKVYDIQNDDLLMREIKNEASAPSHFSRMRSNYKIRREFFNTAVACKNEEYSNRIKKLGFKLK